MDPHSAEHKRQTCLNLTVSAVLMALYLVTFFFAGGRIPLFYLWETEARCCFWRCCCTAFRPCIT